MLLVFGHFFAIVGKTLLFLIIDPILIIAAIVVLCAGPSTRGRPLQESSELLGTLRRGWEATL